MGSVGNDLFGNFILDALEAEGVATGGVRRCDPPTRTSLAFVEIDEEGDREFTFYRSDPGSRRAALAGGHLGRTFLWSLVR